MLGILMLELKNKRLADSMNLQIGNGIEMFLGRNLDDSLYWSLRSSFRADLAGDLLIRDPLED